jgi:hypothetical protein
MKKKIFLPWILIIGLILYLALYQYYIVSGKFYIDDPDSYYYDSISRHIEQPDMTLLGFIAHNSGKEAAQFFIFMISVIVAVSLFYFLKKFSHTKAQIAAIFFLFSPTCLFHNSWFARIDKNMIEILLFMIFILIMLMYKAKSIDWLVPFTLSLVIFFFIAFMLWQGSMLFIVYAAGYIMLYEYFKNPKLLNFKTLILIILLLILSVIVVLMKFPNYMYLVAEGMPNIGHYIFPEVIIFIILYFATAKVMFKQHRKFFIIASLVFFSFIFLPRVMLFMVPMISIIYASSGIKIDRLTMFCALFILASFFVLSMHYFSVDHHLDIKHYPDPCKTHNATGNCVIISQWGKGHFYRNIWNETIMFIAHPSKPVEMLDYLYYRNKTCPPGLDCILVYHPDDYDILDQDRQLLRMPESDSFINFRYRPYANSSTIYSERLPG